jgi:translation initiation factor IF-2
VLEASQNPKRGSSATLIIKNGTLVTGGFVVAGDAYAPVRFIEDFLGTRVEKAFPSEPAVVAGFSKLPTAGAPFRVVETKKEAEVLSKEQEKKETREATASQEEGVGMLPLVIKADVGGSIDAITHELQKISHERAKIRVIGTGVGPVSEGDVKAASAASGVIIAFNVGTDAAASDLAFRDNVQIETFSIIYELSERVGELLAKRAPRVSIEEELGRAKLLKVFSTTSKKVVAGLRYESGVLAVGSLIKVMRGEEEIARGKIVNLQQAKADVKEVHTEGDFGAEFELKRALTYGDSVIAFKPRIS